MKKIVSKIIAFTIVIIMSTPHSMIYALTEKQKLEKEQSKINSEIKEKEKERQELEKQKSAALKAVEELITQISTSEDEVEQLEEQITELKEQISSKEEDIKQKQDEYTKQEELLNTRLIAIYKNGNTSYLDLFLKSNNMSDFLAKYYSASELVEYDKELIQKTQQQKTQIETEKNELENNKNQLDIALEESENKNKELKQLQQEKSKQAQKLTAKEKEVQEEIEALEADNKRVQKEIKAAEEKYKQQLETMQNNSKPNTASKGYLMRPLSGGVVTARSHYSWGKFHGAIDYGVPVGTPIYAAADGVVMLTANLTNSYGTYVVIRHPNGLQSYYGHGKKGSIRVKSGDTVKKGQTIMLSGNTGHSTGPHLHFEVRKSPYNYNRKATNYGQDSRVDPSKYM